MNNNYNSAFPGSAFGKEWCSFRIGNPFGRSPGLSAGAAGCRPAAGSAGESEERTAL